MLRKTVWVWLLFGVVFLPSTLLAQGMMHGKWWHDKSINQELGLTVEEAKILDEKYVESRRRMIDLKSEIEKQRFELDLLLGAEGVARQTIMDRYESLEQARAKLSRARFEMFMAIRDIIGAERFYELKMMRRDRGRKDSKRQPRGGAFRDRDGYRD